MKRAVRLLLAVLLCTCLTQPVYALAENGISAVTGSALSYEYDVTQNQVVDSSVEVTKQAYFSVKIPKNITLSLDTETVEYTFYISGDLASTDKLCVIPSDTLILRQQGKDDVIATVTQDKVEWNYDEIKPDVYTECSGTIFAPGTSAGQWSGSLSFLIGIERCE